MRHSEVAPALWAPVLRIACVLTLLAALAGCNSGDAQAQKAQKPPPVPVDVATVAPHRVDIYSEYPGRVEGKRTVQVVARVEGILEKRHYDEGQIVHKGDLLYTIDPTPFKVTVEQRQAALASAKASLDEAQRTWNRVRQLYKANAVSEAERDQALSGLETARASVQQAKANLDAAQIDLGYTKVKAPLTGVTSLRETDEGSLVSNGTRLTTITQLNPVYVLFALPEDDALARGKALSVMGGQTTDAATRQATILLKNGETYPAQGTVDFTQSTINPDTGTVQLRAVVQNENNTLMPGRYVRARIRLETRSDAIVVPNVAVSDGQGRTQVYTVSDQGKVEATTVELGPNVENGRVIDKGLSAGDRVIVSGLGQISPGASVKVKVKSRGGQDDPGGSGQGGPSNEHAGRNLDGQAVAADDIRRNLRLRTGVPRGRFAADTPPGSSRVMQRGPSLTSGSPRNLRIHHRLASAQLAIADRRTR